MRFLHCTECGKQFEGNGEACQRCVTSSWVHQLLFAVIFFFFLGLFVAEHASTIETLFDLDTQLLIWQRLEWL